MSPQSVRFCCPMRLDCIKESKETVLKIKAEIEMTELRPLLTELPK